MRTSWISRLLVGLVTEAWLVHGMSGHGDFLQKGEAWKFALLGLGAGVGCWVAVQSLTLSQLSEKHRALVFWLGAVGLRLLIMPVTPGDDVWRYRWEGMIQLHGFNPYQLAPDSLSLEHLRDVDWSKINHRSYAAIYPPLTEAIFAGIAALGNSVWCYKILFALADLGVIAMLRRLLARAGAANDCAAWYAWNPLAIYAFAGAAHFDSLMILALLLAIYAFDKCWPSRAPLGHDTNLPEVPALYWLSGLLLGLAIALKLVPLVLLPVWALAGGSWRRALGMIPLTLAPVAILALAYGFPNVQVFATVRQFGSSFRVNDPVWWLVEAAGWPNPSGSNGLYEGCTLVLCVALAYCFRHDGRRGILWVLGVALLLSPVVHAWYVLWVLPVAVWRGARAWFVFSISMFGYYLLWEVNHASGRPWQEPLWLRIVILLPPLVATVWMVIADGPKLAVATRPQNR